MADHAKGDVIVLGPEEGEAFWQPLPSTGYVINKINPYNSPYDTFSTGIQVLEPGAHSAATRTSAATSCCSATPGAAMPRSTGSATNSSPETMILVGRGLQHKVVNAGDGQMRLLWFIAPPGLEDWFRALGRPRRPGEPVPAPFERPANVEMIQAQQRFIRPDVEVIRSRPDCGRAVRSTCPPARG